MLVAGVGSLVCSAHSRSFSQRRLAWESGSPVVAAVDAFVWLRLYQAEMGTLDPGGGEPGHARLGDDGAGQATATYQARTDTDGKIHNHIGRSKRWASP